MINLENIKKQIKDKINKQEDITICISGKERIGMSCLSQDISKFIIHSQQEKKSTLTSLGDGVTSPSGDCEPADIIKYKTIVIDPPWTVKNNLKDLKYYRTGKKMPYEMMSEEEIINFPINDFADKQCDLFLWTITSKIPFCFELLKKWGFRYMDFFACRLNQYYLQFQKPPC